MTHISDNAPLVLYGMTSPNVRKISLMLEELETPYSIRQVKVFGGEQFTPEFKSLNPFSKVPILVDRDAAPGGYAVFESGAILVYLAEKFGSFLPASGLQRYETLKWLFGQTSNIGPMFGQLNHFRMAKEAGPAPYERYRGISRKLYRVLDTRLGEHPYLAGKTYSIADIATYHWAGYLDQHGFDPADFPNLTRWRAEIGERPAVQREAEVRERFVFAPEDSLQSASKANADAFWWRD